MTHDKKERFSYTKLDTLVQCPYKFLKKYEEKLYSSKKSLALELGSIAHKGKEMVTIALINGDKPDYSAIKDFVYEGHGDQLRGVRELKREYIFDWAKPDEKSGLTYEQKLELYFTSLPAIANDREWRPIACEQTFSVDIQGYCVAGSIDRIDKNAAGEYRIADYKTSKKLFDDAEVKTPLQMVIYDYGVLDAYKATPIAHQYEFIFLGQIQEACSKGYFARGEKKLAKIFEQLEECRTTKIYTPKPSPLCHWCDYCSTNPNAEDQLKAECVYHSLWTPINKTFQVNREFKPTAQIDAPGAFWF